MFNQGGPHTSEDINLYEEAVRSAIDEELLSAVGRPYRTSLPSTAVPNMLLTQNHQVGSIPVGGKKKRKGSVLPTTPLAKLIPQHLQTLSVQATAGNNEKNLPEPLKTSEMMAILIVGENVNFSLYRDCCVMF